MSSESFHFTVIFWTIFGLILGLVVLVRRWRWRAGPAAPTGFGGWLVLLAIQQTLAPVGWLYQAYATLSLRTIFALFPNGPTVITVEAGLDVLFAIYALIVCIRMYQRSPAFRILFTAQWAMVFVFGTVEPAIVAFAIAAPTRDLYSGLEFEKGIVSLLIGLLWLIYVWRSARVRNTFRLSQVAAAATRTP